MNLMLGQLPDKENPGKFTYDGNIEESDEIPPLLPAQNFF